MNKKCDISSVNKTSTKKTGLHKSILIVFFSILISSLAFTQSQGNDDWIIEEEQREDQREESQNNIESKVQKELRIVQSPGYLNLDPQLSSYASEAQILTGLYEGLFAYDPFSLEPLPALATSYKVSRDKKTWTFTIRKNAKFSNGEAINAESFYNSWLALIDPRKNAPFASLFDIVEGAQEYRLGIGSKDKVGIQAKDSETLIVKLIHPTDYFAKILCHHAFSVVHTNKAVQSGPFFISQQSKNELVLEKNTFYWDASAVALPSIRFLFSDDDDENTYLFNTGELHWLSTSFNASKLIDNDSLAFGTQYGTEYYFFKMQGRIWDNPKAREALLLALPWEELRKNFYVPANTLLSRLYGYPQIYGIEETDIEEAKAILDSLNLTETEKKLQIFIPDTSYHIEQAETFIQNWEEIGIKTSIIKAEPYTYYEAISQSEADLFTYTWIGDFADPMAFLELFKKDSSLNESLWENSLYEELLQEATSISDSSQRYKKLSEAEQELLDNFIILPLSHPVSVNIIDKSEIGGWYENALDLHPLKNLYFKEKRMNKNLLIAADTF